MNKVKNIYKILDTANVDEKVGVKLARICEGETYQIIQGSGSMMIGKKDSDTIIWDEPKNMNEGECLNINANEIHQLLLH